ncbi:MAG: glycosyltransferase [Candidatus Eisenbacteria bacterium]|nr:glycosyltransferase [Candidatus Latescibacterota bacterium]MBD3303103.1 glycosyltransferase [Candidatus Eisenbacteria bacterium]
MRVVHLNSTREGGGVAEILDRLVPLKRELGLDTVWEVIQGEPPFYVCTKGMHNALQGDPVDIGPDLLRVYEETNRSEADRLRGLLEDADMVFIHDPQPAQLITHCPRRKGPWVWRCHIDLSRPHRPVWKYLRRHVKAYYASIWHIPSFAQPLERPQYLIPPSIDPLSEKNRDLNSDELQATYRTYALDPDRPILLQVSRFDRFKDPIGVIQAYRLAKRFVPLQLILAGGTASDDPEGRLVLEHVRDAASGDPDIHVLLLPPDAHRTINALQRIADLVLQKSLKEGFGLTVTEAMWKQKPVIGGDVGGIRLQVVNHHTGFLVSTPEGAAHRIRYLLKNRGRLNDMGRKAYRFVQESFLLTRHLREYLTLMVGLAHNSHDRIEL